MQVKVPKLDVAIRLDAGLCRNFEVSSRREWILSNGIGGYAMGTVSGVNTRRYHGLLVAAMPGSMERVVLLASLEAHAELDGRQIPLSTHQYPGAVHPEGYLSLAGFTLGSDACWEFQSSGAILGQRVTMQRGENASRIEYVNRGDRAVRLVLRPLVCRRSYHHTFHHSASYPGGVEVGAASTQVVHEGLCLVLDHPSAAATPVGDWYFRMEHLRDLERGQEACEDLYCPCELVYDIAPGGSAILEASVAGSSPCPLDGSDSQSAADLFLVQEGPRRTVLAGYPWFTDWGRDTMIALPSLCEASGRWDFGKGVLIDWLANLQCGLIPNRVTEVSELETNTADATLWMAHACHKILAHQWDREFAELCLKGLRNVFEAHRAGTRHGIRVDPADGLLMQGEEGSNLTWMDAKVDGVAVTPRQGKAIEICGLWIHALGVMRWISERLDAPRDEFEQAWKRAQASFEGTFWRSELGHYLDVAHPDDPSLRPNQAIALSLPFVEANPDHARRALAMIRSKLLTPRGLRTLSPDDPRYRGRFEGPLSERDRAYHQGTAWPWLLGPYVAACLRYDTDRPALRRLLIRSREMWQEYGLGGVAEVYDGDVPQHPGGCPWQAWSVAALLDAEREVLGNER